MDFVVSMVVAVVKDGLTLGVKKWLPLVTGIIVVLLKDKKF